MIEFQIIESSDKDISEIHTYSFNKVAISNTHNDAFLQIDDPEMNGVLFLIEVNNVGLDVRTHPAKKSYLSNGKKTTGAKTHKISDELTFGKTKLKILNFQQTDFPHQVSLPERYKNASQDPQAAKTLETLEAELLHLEYILNAQNE